MDHRPKSKNLSKKTWSIFATLGKSKNCLKRTEKALSIKEKIDKLDIIKLKTTAYQKALLRK